MVSSGVEAPGQRIHGSVTDGETFVLSGNTRPVVRAGAAREVGKVPGGQAMPRLSLHFSMTAKQRADLEQLLTAQQDRRSAQYHKFLTPEQYAERFGLDAADVAKVTRWLEDSGFFGLQVARSRTWVSFAGTAGQVDAAFHVAMRRYSMNGEMHFANQSDPRLPKALEGIAQSVRGLHDFVMKPQHAIWHKHYTGDGGNYVTPADWATIYDVNPLYGAGLDGTGVTIAIVGQSDVLMSDIAAFRAAAGLSAKAPTVVVPPGDQDPGLQSMSGDEGESDLDIEWAGAIARNADILFVTAGTTGGNGVQDSITYAIDNNVAPIVSISYGVCEADVTSAEFSTQNGLYAQANSQGMTIVAASGDVGAAGCDTGKNETEATHPPAVLLPASSQYVTGVGGTELDEEGAPEASLWNGTNSSGGGSALSYIPEAAWNDGFQLATGGGASALVTKPSWQAGQGVPNDGARDVPDLAFTASPVHDGLLFCSQDWCTNGFLNAQSQLELVGGTSATAPAFAGVLALTIQKGGASSRRLGNVNANLYSLAQISSNAFHDVTYGNNSVLCQVNTTFCTGGQYGFTAGQGYDQATGLGSLDVYNFAEQWYGDFQVTANPNTVTLNQGASTSAVISIAPVNGFQGVVSFSCSTGSLVQVTCSVPGTVDTSGTTTLTITAGVNAKTPGGWRLRMLPPVGGGWLAVLVAFGSLLFFVPGMGGAGLGKRRAYWAGAASVLVIGTVAISCGGSSGPSSKSTSASLGRTTSSALSLSCNLLNALQTGYPFSGSCAASGGTAPYRYSISAGALPSGLAINASTGAITGTPTTAATSSFTVDVTDSGSPEQTALQAESGISVAVGALELSCDAGNGTVGLPYHATCQAQGGVEPYTYSNYAVAGALPPGLTVSATTGLITGTPTAIFPAFSYSAIMVTDSGTSEQSTEFNAAIAVNPAGTVGQTLGVTCLGTPAYLGVGNYFSVSCKPYNGQPPFTYSVNGALPPGVTFANAAVSGAATAAGTYTGTLMLADGSSPPLTAALGPYTCVVFSHGAESGLLVITATSGAIVNTTTITVNVQ